MLFCAVLTMAACTRGRQSSTHLENYASPSTLGVEAYRVEDAAKLDPSYAGFVLVGSPPSQVKVAFIGDAKAKLQKLTSNQAFVPLSVKRSMRELVVLQSHAEQELTKHGIPFRVIAIDVLHNDVVASIPEKYVSAAKRSVNVAHLRFIK
jgi:hypothetical protein